MQIAGRGQGSRPGDRETQIPDYYSNTPKQKVMKTMGICSAEKALNKIALSH